MFLDLLNALEETLFMIFTSSLITILLGFPLSILQALPASRTSTLSQWFHKFLNVMIPLVSSIPYIIILIAVLPFTRWLMQANAQHASFIAIIPLSLAAFPLFTKLCTDALKNVPHNLIETAISLGGSPRQLVFKVIIPEALPNIIHGFTQLLIQIIGLSVVVGVLGAGGIGRLLVEKGYQNYHTGYVLSILGILMALVMSLKVLGHFLAFGNFKSKD